MFGIFLDDERDPEDVFWVDYPDGISWMVVRDPEEFDRALQQCLAFNTKFVVSFDHDIQAFEGSVETTGYHLLKRMCHGLFWRDDMARPEVDAYFHSQNIIGKTNMELYWDQFVKLRKEYSSGAN